MSMSSKKSGFTLIELLVVIAIIGLLAAVVLASLGSARGKGQDAAVKSQLHAAAAQAELYATINSNSYSGVCTAAHSASGLVDILLNAKAATGANGVVTNAQQFAGKVACEDTARSWVISAPLLAGKLEVELSVARSKQGR